MMTAIIIAMMGRKNTSTTVSVCRKKRLKRNTVDKYWKQ